MSADDIVEDRAPAVKRHVATVAQEAAAAEAQKPMHEFLVKWRDLSGIYVAQNDRDAWAIFCDANRVWPNPKTGTVEAVDEKLRAKLAAEKAEARKRELADAEKRAKLDKAAAPAK